jgi:hypothetical protein
MRLAVGFTFAAFLSILAAAGILSARARPQMIDVDPAAMRTGTQRK